VDALLLGSIVNVSLVDLMALVLVSVVIVGGGRGGNADTEKELMAEWRKSTNFFDYSNKLNMNIVWEYWTIWARNGTQKQITNGISTLFGKGFNSFAAI